MSIARGSYNLAQYWKDLKADLDKEFSNESSLSDEKTVAEDEKAYQTQLIVLKQMLTLGTKVEEISTLSDLNGSKRGALGKQLDALAVTHFGKDEMPPIAGKKSLKFAENIYLPHMDRFKKVLFSEFIILAAKIFVGIDIVKRQENAKKQVLMLTAKIDAYKKSQQTPLLKPLLAAGSATELAVIKKPALSLKYDPEEFVTVIKYDPHPELIRRQQENEKLAKSYSDQLINYIDNVLKKDSKIMLTEKGMHLFFTKLQLESGAKGIHGTPTVENMKKLITQVREKVTPHRNKVERFFQKHLKARDTSSIKELNKLFDEKNNFLKPR